MHHASKLHAAGHSHLVVVAGGGREKEFHKTLNQYNGKKGAHGHYNFKSIKVVSSGKRDPDAEGTEGISGTKMRDYARSGLHDKFKQGLPKALHPHAKEIHGHVAGGPQMKEQHAKGGFDYEHSVNNNLQKHGLQKKGQASAGASADAPDGSIHASGKHHHLEIKKDHKAMMGQVGLLTLIKR